MRRAIFFLCLLLVADLIIMFSGHWYLRHTWIDIPFHLLGGFFVAMLFSDYLKAHFRPNSTLQNILIIVGVTVFIGVIWEFMEYSGGALQLKFISRYIYIGDIEDTIKDLSNDTFGAIVYTLAFISRKKY